MYVSGRKACLPEAVAPWFQGQTTPLKKKKKGRSTQNKDLSHVQALLSRICKDVVRHTSLVRVFRNRSGLIKNTSPFDQQEKKSLTNSGPEWGVIIRPIRTDKTPWAEESSPFSSSEGAEQYCGSAHTSWEQTELPQDSVKKKRESINISSNYSLFLVQIKASTPTVLQVEMALLFSLLR